MDHELFLKNCRHKKRYEPIPKVGDPQAMIARYPYTTPLTLELRPLLHNRLAQLPAGVSEFCFAGLYLFRETHQYRVTLVDDDLIVLLGQDGEEPFFMCPFGLPSESALGQLLDDRRQIKAATETQAEQLRGQSLDVWADRDNFDYLYRRIDLAELPGRKYHKKRNHVNAFLENHDYEARPLLEEEVPQALKVLDAWHEQYETDADYRAAREALELNMELQLCGGIYYVEDEPVAYTLGEELAQGKVFVIHFEKAIRVREFRGLYQFVNQSFAGILPEKYHLINREQDLGDPGLRQAKESYKPCDFVRKYRASRA